MGNDISFHMIHCENDKVWNGGAFAVHNGDAISSLIPSSFNIIPPRDSFHEYKCSENDTDYCKVKVTNVVWYDTIYDNAPWEFNAYDGQYILVNFAQQTTSIVSSDYDCDDRRALLFEEEARDDSAATSNIEDHDGDGFPTLTDASASSPSSVSKLRGGQA